MHNARSRLGETSVRMVTYAEEAGDQNMTERPNIPFTLEMKFCPSCHILSQEWLEEVIATIMPVVRKCPTIYLPRPLLHPPALIFQFSPSLQYATSRQSTIISNLAILHPSHDPSVFRLSCFAYDLPGGPMKEGAYTPGCA